MNPSRMPWRSGLLAAVSIELGLAALPSAAQAVVSPYSLRPQASPANQASPQGPPAQAALPSAPALIVRPPTPQTSTSPSPQVTPPTYDTPTAPQGGTPSSSDGGEPRKHPSAHGAPEPATAVTGLLGSVLLGLAALRRKRGAASPAGPDQGHAEAQVVAVPHRVG